LVAAVGWSTNQPYWALFTDATPFVGSENSSLSNSGTGRCRRNPSGPIDNIRGSGARYLLTTTFLEHEQNEDIEDGDWRMLNLRRPPFDFASPVDVLIEGCVEGDGAYADKALGLWAL